jgi:hypothetical protein
MPTAIILPADRGRAHARGPRVRAGGREGHPPQPANAVRGTRSERRTRPYRRPRRGVAWRDTSAEGAQPGAARLGSSP